MSHKSQHNSQRRPPAERPEDEHQDSDWGFDDDEVDPGIEKKLGIALVVCLLAGFGFVFYQKFQLLQGEASEAGAGAADVAEQSSDESDSTGAGVVDLSDVQPQDGESPFFEDPAPTSAPEAESTWTLAQSPRPASNAAQKPTELPPLPAQIPADSPADSFDPFAEPENVESASAGPAEVPTITWDDPPKPAPPQSDPEPFLLDETDTTAAHPEEDDPPFLLEQSRPSENAVASAEPEPAEEPPLLFLDESSEPSAMAEDEPAIVSLDPLPDQSEPQQGAETAPSLPVIDDSSTPTQQGHESNGGFDPFAVTDNSLDESQPAPPAAAPQEPFPFLAPPDQDEPQRQPASGVAAEPPAWPFAESSSDATAGERTPVINIKPDQPDGVAFESESLPSIGEPRPPSPFAADGAAPIPVVTPILSTQAVIGEREVTVTEEDSFWSICEREYGTPTYFSALARYNRDRVPKAEKLQAGIMIRVPPPEVLESQFPELFLQASRRPGDVSQTSSSSPREPAVNAGFFVGDRRQPLYRVGEKDTLSSIAEAHLGRASRWTEIYELNRGQLLSPSTLKIGTVLKLPADASGVSVSAPFGINR